MDKLRRKALLKELAEKDLARFRNELPVKEYLFPKLFDFLNKKLSVEDCKNDFTLTNKFCDNENIEKLALIKWLDEQGAACDCEILNLEDAFQYLHPIVARPQPKPQSKRQKLNSLELSNGFNIPSVPSPWVLTETILNDEPVYSFQIGKGTDCIVSLEGLFPIAQFENDQYWIDLWFKETELNCSPEDLLVERTELDNYFSVVVKSKNWIPVLYWIKSKGSYKWHLRMKTGISRQKGDVKEIAKLLNCIELKEQ